MRETEDSGGKFAKSQVGLLVDVGQLCQAYPNWCCLPRSRAEERSSTRRAREGRPSKNPRLLLIRSLSPRWYDSYQTRFAVHHRRSGAIRAAAPVLTDDRAVPCCEPPSGVAVGVGPVGSPKKHPCQQPEPKPGWQRGEIAQSGRHSHSLPCEVTTV